MNKKIVNYAVMFLLLFLAGGFLNVKPCKAASAEVTITADSSEVTVGDDIFVYVNIDSDTEFGNFEASVTYDDSLLQYNGGSPVISGSSGFLHISDMNVAEGDNSRKYVLEFEALKVGICTISFSGRAVVYDFETDSEMSVSSNDLSLNVKAPETASSDAKLKDLKISPSGLSPSFDPEVNEYSVNVGYETEHLIITALPENSKASVSISGNDFLKEGENNVVISVLAESGDIIKYTIKVNREEAPKADTPDDSAVSPDSVKDTFEIIEADGVSYAIYSGKYKITEPDSSVKIPEGYQLGSLTITGITIPAYLPVSNEASEFILIYAENEFGDKGFYQYDRIEKTLQRYATSGILINGSHAAATDTDTLTEKYHANLTKAVFVIALLSALCLLMIFVTVRMFFKLKGYKEDDLD